MSRRLSTAVICLVLAACQAPPDVRNLEAEKASLEQQLSGARNEIAMLRANTEQLQTDIAELKRVISVLEEEKTSRVDESMGLRGEVRRFVQAQIDNLKQFMLHSDLLDYIGGELVERPIVDAEPLLVVDLENRVPRAGTLTGVGGWFAKPGVFTVKVLRPVDDALIAVWESPPVQIEEPGVSRVQFSVAVGIEAGDVLAYHFPEQGMAGYNTGTGDSRYTDRNLPLGATLRPSSLSGASEKRAYAIGVYGLLNPN